MSNIINKIFKTKGDSIAMFSNKNPEKVGYRKLTSHKCDKRYLYTCNLDGKANFTIDRKNGEVYVKKT